ncbi:hypothetical protein [Alteromonas lipolytica]|uniref:Uncharacterized protein n=1 Tax=Alteromonas lipolytica TaxID=1856405 RepID=A0A1E8FIH1_9ALTE|nr:hypothetical protein [Alteromonas lipolytica]OFI35731.1 hypothetical protein BFC17_10615 [Alteromonas lipolytica]GGF80300.1 hypothetical protein GCM10011338_35710 [Alteromonas lipolytica]
MLEAIYSVVTVIVNAIGSALAFVVEFIAGFFVPAGHTLTAVDLFLFFFVLCAEVTVWFVLSLFRLVKGAITRQKPVFKSKPVFWRPTPKVRH